MDEAALDRLVSAVWPVVNTRPRPDIEQAAEALVAAFRANQDAEHPDISNVAHGRHLPPSWEAIKRDLDEQDRQRAAEWDRHAKQRDAADAAMQRARERRQRELGSQEPVRVAACLEWARPRPSVIG